MTTISCFCCCCYIQWTHLDVNNPHDWLFLIVIAKHLLYLDSTRRAAREREEELTIERTTYAVQVWKHQWVAINEEVEEEEDYLRTWYTSNRRRRRRWLSLAKSLTSWWSTRACSVRVLVIIIAATSDTAHIYTSSTYVPGRKEEKMKLCFWCSSLNDLSVQQHQQRMKVTWLKNMDKTHQQQVKAEERSKGRVVQEK